MSKNVAVFVDVANIFYAAKAAGVDIDYVTLLKAASAGRDLVRAYAYTGLDPDNENQRNFHDFLRRSNYKVVSKDIRKYGDGKVKANLDIELVVDMMKTARNLDIAIVVSGDGDFAPAIRAVQEQGVRVEVISFRGNTSSDLIEVADQFTDIVQLARVEKGSRSGRRVADGDDLSMTEVPDKQTEGTGAGRGRGRPRGRGRDAEPVAASDTRSRGRGRLAPVNATERIETAPGGSVVALPGERLSRAAGSLTEADLAKAEVFTLDDLDADVSAVDTGVEPANGAALLDEDGEPRRRRRRGGRGRGRGRGREDGALEGDAEPGDAVTRAQAPALSAEDALDIEEDEIEDARIAAAATAAAAAPAPRGPRTTPFGSVWDSQLGTPTAPAARTGSAPAPLEDEDFDEPEIPEYLIAEQRRNAQGGGGGRGVRGGRAAYQSAVSRERYGGGRGGGGINRYPDVSGRSQVQQDRPPRDDRNYNRGGDRPAPRTPAPSAPRSGSNEPWSDVPPELEAMLRAQVAAKPAPSHVPATAAPAEAVTSTPVAGTTATGRSRTTRTSTARTPRASRTASSETTASAAAAPAGTDLDVASGSAPAPKARAAAKPRTTTRKTATAASGTADAATSATTTAAPAAAAKPKATRKPAAKATAAPAGGAAATDGDAPAPKRRTTRKTATADPT